MITNASGAAIFDADDYDGFAAYASGAMSFEGIREFTELPWTDRKSKPRRYMAACTPFDGRFGTYFLVRLPSKGVVQVVRVQKRS